MSIRIIATILLFFRKIIRRFESVFFWAKNNLSERNFIYLSSVAVAISCSLAVIILKSFAHSVFVFANYVNGYLKLPFANSLFPIIGILLTVFVIKKFLDGSIEKGSSRILFSVAIAIIPLLVFGIMKSINFWPNPFIRVFYQTSIGFEIKNFPKPWSSYDAIEIGDVNEFLNLNGLGRSAFAFRQAGHHHAWHEPTRDPNAAATRASAGARAARCRR